MSQSVTPITEAVDSKSYGGNPRRRERDFGRVFTGILFALFVIALLMAILTGTSVYRGLHQQEDIANTQRLSLTLLANDVRANDQINEVGRAWVTEASVDLELAVGKNAAGLPLLTDEEKVIEGSLLDGPALVLRETLDSGAFETRLYSYDGTIMEEYALVGSPYNPEGAIPIVKSSKFDFTYRNGLLTIYTDAGQVTVTLRCAGGDRA